jgi:hypothetical protein
MCPCQYGRVGAFLTTAAIYLAFQWGGIPAMIELALAGNLIAIAWGAAALLGVGNLLIAIREALSHDDGFELSSVVWSGVLIAIAAWGLVHHWYLGGGALWFHLSRAAWVGLIASGVFNIWLNVRGFRRRRHDDQAPVHHPAPPHISAVPLTQRSLRRFQSQNGEWSEATEWYGNNHPYQPREKFFPAPPQFSENATPQIVWLPDERGELIAYAPDRNGNYIALPPQQVPVNRRLR